MINRSNTAKTAVFDLLINGRGREKGGGWKRWRRELRGRPERLSDVRRFSRVDRVAQPRAGRRTRSAVGTALAAVALTALAACGSAGTPTDPAIAAPGPMVGQRMNVTLPAAVTNGVLVSSSGKRFSLASLRGKVVVISDAMTLCQETCPLDTANVVAAARAAQHAGVGNRIVFLSVTVDPERDTPVQLAAYRRLFAPAPADWLTVTGDPAQLATLWKTLGVYIHRVPDTPPYPRNWRTGKPLSYDITHSDEVFFLDKSGHERFLLEGAPHLAPHTSLPRTLAKFLDAHGQRNITHPSKLAWTLPQELQVLSWLTQHHIAGSS
jgi:protein SCO1/2